MRKIVFGTVIAAVMVFLVALFIRLPRSADASDSQARVRASDIYAIELAIDVKALPKYDILSEADE